MIRITHTSTPAMSAAVAGRTRKPPPPASAFFAPSSLSSRSLLHLLIAAAGDLVASYSNRCRLPRHHRRNARSLIRRIQILLALFEFLLDYRRPLPSLAMLCLKEFYIVVHRARFLLDYCLQASRIWLLFRNQIISGHFNELGREISTLLDILPLNELRLAADVQEQVELLKRQVGSARLHIDSRDEELRIQVLSFVNDFEEKQLPDSADLKSTFLDRLGILNSGDFEFEIEFLEEQINNHEEFDAEADTGNIAGVIAVVRYCRYLLCGIHETGEGKQKQRSQPAQNSITAPKDFCCPISLELMSDPVVASTGQTYDRGSIAQWINGGHRTCPNSGLTLDNTGLIPNCALRSLISNWCAANRVPSSMQRSTGLRATAETPKAAVEATRATARILIRHLSTGDLDSKVAAARELRLLAKIGKENRAIIAEEGAIPLLSLLLHSRNPAAQENAVTALLNLSIHDANKKKIMKQEGCLNSIVSVLRRGLTPESRENAAVALFSLSALHDYKKRIVEEPGGAEALAWLLRKGSATGKKDAVMALFNLSMHPESWERMVGSGAVEALVGALGDEIVAEEAAGALALLARRSTVAEMVRWEEKAVVGLAGVMRSGSAVGRENAAAALHEICRRGGAVVADRVARVPGVAGVVHTVALDGTKRARRKAAELARMLQRRERMAAGDGRWTREQGGMG